MINSPCVDGIVLKTGPDPRKLRTLLQCNIRKKLILHTHKWGPVSTKMEYG